MGQTEVTFAEWDRCVEAGVCPQVDDKGWGRGDRPVINVSWHQVQDYIQWLNKDQRLSGSTRYRLPSEAEWEYATRGGTQTAYFWGKQSQCEFANGPDQTAKKGARLDYSGGVENQGFYLKNCGFSNDKVDIGTLFTRKKLLEAPKVDFRLLE